MSGFRVFLLVLAACVAIGAIGGYALWTRYGAAAFEEIARLNEEAIAFGRANEQSDCVPEAILRLRACPDVICELVQPAFTRACLSSARPSEDLCEDVPDSWVQALVWSQTACADLDVSKPICDRILRELVRACLAREL